MNEIKIELTEEEKSSFISTFQDPFKKESVRKIELTIESSPFKKNVEFKAMIRFQRGPTTGYHNIESDDFSSLIKNVEGFLQTLD